VALLRREVAPRRTGDYRRCAMITPKPGFGVTDMDRLTSMAVFKRTVELGSFAAAARQFGISAEMAGNHVRALETRLGVRLLNRSTRRLHVTEAGSGYYARCTKILAEIEETEAEANALNATPRGLLRIAVPVTFGLQHVAPVISEYMTRYPEVTFDVAVSDRFVNLIEEGFDLAVRIGELRDSNLIVRRLASTQLVVCASPAYLQRAGCPRTPGELGSHVCLTYTETAASDTWHFESLDGKAETVRVLGTLTANNAGLVREIALAGHGVILGPGLSFEDDIAAGRLVPLLDGWRSTGELAVHVIYPHRSFLSAKVRSFVDLLVERIGSKSERRATTDAVDGSRGSMPRTPG
jgi:DNA-binding transcriptional LysR family regulator